MSTAVATLLEMRVLSGEHAGARAALERDEYTLGTSDDCDFVLTDEGLRPQHARLVRREEQWQVEWLDAANDEQRLPPVSLQSGHAVALGPIMIAADDPVSPWPTLERLVLVPQAQLQELPPPPAEPVATDVAARPARTRGAIAWITAVTAAICCAAAIVFWPERLNARAEPSREDAPKPQGPDAAQRARIQSALQKLKLADGVVVSPAGERWRVETAALSDEDSDALTSELSKMQPRPVLRIVAEQDLLDEVTETSSRIAAEQHASVTTKYARAGRFRVEGRVDTAADRDKLVKALKTALPLVRGWDVAVLENGDVARLLIEDLRARGDWDISSTVADGSLDMQVQLREQQVPQWEASLAAAVKVNPAPFHAQISFKGVTASSPRSAVATLPFDVRGVIGGENPYVVLLGGEKLARGGTWKGWRLVEISSTQVVFDNESHRAILQR